VNGPKAIPLSSSLDQLPQRICLLGAGGFLGSHLSEALMRRTGAELGLVDRSFAKLEMPRDDRARVVEGSLQDPGVLEGAVAGCDAVVSMTALCNPSLYNTRPRDVIHASFSDLVPLVELCATRRIWLVHFSTCEVYGKPHPSPGSLMSEDESSLLLGPIHRERWTYACAKQLLERLIWAHGQHSGLPFTIIRPFNVIGPRMDYLPGVDGDGTPRVLACFMAALLAQRPLALVNGGEQRRAFLDVRDFTDALLRVLASPARCQGEVLNLGHPGNELSIAELARRMVRLYAERHGGDPALPLVPQSGEDFYGPGYDDSERRVPDTRKAEELLGWRPRHGLDDMLPTIIDDYVARYPPAAADHRINAR